MPATIPSAGVFLTRSSIVRRRRCAAITSAPYSTKVPGSHRSSIFSRVVRCPVLRRRATASGRAASSPSPCRSTTSARSGRTRSRFTSLASAALRRLDFGLLDKRQRMPFEDRVALGNRDAPHDSALVGRDDVFHLHRFHHEQLLAAMHAVAFADVDGNDRALHRRLDRHRVFRRRDVVYLRRHDGGSRGNRRRRIALRFPVMEHGQRIARVDLCARAPRTCAVRIRSGSRRRAIKEQPPMAGFCRPAPRYCPRRSACTPDSR